VDFSGAAEAAEERHQRFQSELSLQKLVQEMAQQEAKTDFASWVVMAGRVSRFP
jgi:hypothetical protein